MESLLLPTEVTFSSLRGLSTNKDRQITDGVLRVILAGDYAGALISSGVKYYSFNPNKLIDESSERDFPIKPQPFNLSDPRLFIKDGWIWLKWLEPQCYHEIKLCQSEGVISDPTTTSHGRPLIGYLAEGLRLSRQQLQKDKHSEEWFHQLQVLIGYILAVNSFNQMHFSGYKEKPNLEFSMSEQKHFHFPKIPDFYKAQRDMRKYCEYKKIPLPVQRFRGTPKLHGTNAGVLMSLRTKEIYAVSREQILSDQLPLGGFYAHFKENENFYRIYLEAMVDSLPHSENATHVGVWGEWVGAGVQALFNKAAISKIPKTHILLRGAFITDRGEKESLKEWFHRINHDFWINAVDDLLPCARHIFEFPCLEVEVDFTKPDAIQNELVVYTQAYEKECPVAATYGINGVGEGIVWHNVPDGGDWPDITFKVKGQEHSKSHVRPLDAKNQDKVEAINRFVTEAASPMRMSEIAQKMKDNGYELIYEYRNVFVGRVCKDIHDEEAWKLENTDIGWGNCTPGIVRIAHNWWAELTKMA